MEAIDTTSQGPIQSNEAPPTARIAPPTRACCSTTEASSCCEPSAKAGCCGPTSRSDEPPATCGCR
jgi:hypothetical protein